MLCFLAFSNANFPFGKKGEKINYRKFAIMLFFFREFIFICKIIYNQNKMKKLLITTICAGILCLSACKKEDDTKSTTTTPTTNTTPTLNKDNLVGKVWESQSGTTQHDFKANGIYSVSGTWAWLNNSDSMKLKQFTADVERIWYFKYCQGDSLECKLTSTGGWIKMKDHNW